jgi:hypothetical protein
MVVELEQCYTHGCGTRAVLQTWCGTRAVLDTWLWNESSVTHMVMKLEQCYTHGCDTIAGADALLWQQCCGTQQLRAPHAPWQTLPPEPAPSPPLCHLRPVSLSLLSPPFLLH